MLDLLIVGAGPTGLTLALGARTYGLRCRIVDAATGPNTTSRAHDCQARTLEVLDDYGVASDVVARATTVEAVQLFLGRRRARVAWEPPPSPFSRPYLLPQCALEALLREHLCRLDVRVEWGSRFEALVQAPDCVEARLSSPSGGAPQTVSARWLAGCDGAHSEVRRQLGIPFPGATYPQVYHLGDVRLDGLAAQASHVWLDPEGVVLAIPLDGDGAWRLFADVSTLAGDGAATAPSQALFQAILARQRCEGGLRIRDVGWMSTFRLHRRHASHYRRGRVFLAGDAAHIFPPFSGQGMNTGIQDAYNLAWKLGLVQRGILRPSALDTYHAERHAIGAQALRDAHRNTRIVTLRSPVACLVRDVFAGIAVQSRAYRRWMTTLAAGLKITYRGLSPLVQQHGWSRGPRAGDRAPDVPLAVSGEAATRLFEALRGTHHVLLLFDGRRRALGARRLSVMRWWVKGYLGTEARLLQVDPCTDPTGAAHAAFAIRGPTAILVRPDGHIGFRGGPRAAAALRRYLWRNYQPPHV
jgi:2-polyprenyl-6-methoxyphenol hydroxylase-like FAD-dependent oxidoreductase